MGGFSADKTSAKMLSKMTAVVHGSHSDESHEKPLERIYLVKANHPRWTSLDLAGRESSDAEECSVEAGKEDTI